jgi:hypothetical protein
MFAAMLFAISIVALSQFAAYYWRAMLAGAAAQPVSERILSAVGAENGEITGRYFPALLGIHDMTPELNSSGNRLLSVRVYYRLIAALNSLVGQGAPAIGAWSQRELAVCARYAAVQIDRRWQTNLELAASLRSC